MNRGYHSYVTIGLLVVAGVLIFSGASGGWVVLVLIGACAVMMLLMMGGMGGKGGKGGMGGMGGKGGGMGGHHGSDEHQHPGNVTDRDR